MLKITLITVVARSPLVEHDLGWSSLKRGPFKGTSVKRFSLYEVRLIGFSELRDGE